MDIGAGLRQARLQAGLSREELSQRTKIQLAKIEALEANAFERLPDGIYLDGLLRAYAAAVGLDGNELVERLHRHNAKPVEDVIFTSASTEPLDEFGRENYPTTFVEVADDFDRPLDHHAASASLSYVAGIDEPTGTRDVDRFVDPGEFRDPPLMFGTGGHTGSQPRRGTVSRILIPLLVICVAIALGAVLYDRTHPVDGSGSETAASAPHANQPERRPDAASASHDPDNTPSAGVALADRPGTTDHHAEKPPEEPVAPRPSDAIATTARPSRTIEPSRSAGDAREPAAGALGATGATGAPAAAEPDASATEPAPDLSGHWSMDTTVEASSVQDFRGLRLGYQLELQQSGNRISGQGRKTLENGKQIVDFAQTPIAVSGTVEGKRLTLTFTERGRQRESGGKMILDLLEEGVMRGRFSSSAAQSSGIVEARRGG